MKCTFKKVEATTEEIIKRMVDGEVFYSESGSVGYCYDQESKQFEWRENQEAYDLSGFDFPLYERIEQPWYEDPDFKLPCLMWVGAPDNFDFAYIEKFNKISGLYADRVGFEYHRVDLTPIPRDENGNYIVYSEVME